MTESAEFWRKQLHSNASPVDAGTRIWEIVCGLIMVLTFTGSVNAALPAREEIKVILWAALGCNTAWGLVDALMYLMSTWMERSQALRALKGIRAKPYGEARELIKEYLPAIIGRVMDEKTFDNIKNKLIQLPDPPGRAYLVVEDIKNAGVIFFLVFLSTFPAVIPFLFDIKVNLAMRLSNVIVLLVLFFCGFILGGQSGYRRIFFGLGLAVIGAVLVAIIMALGG